MFKPNYLKGQDIHEGKVKETLGFSFREYSWPFFFMVSASLLGLQFPLAYLLILFILINRWRNNRYDFIIQLTILSGGFSILRAHEVLHFPYYIAIVFISIFLMLIYKKNKLEKKLVLWYALYVVYVLFFAYLSAFSLRKQLFSIIEWISICYFIIPIACFANKEFDFKVFLKRIYPYFFIFCLFYVLDGIILSGNFFISRDTIIEEPAMFYNVNLHPFSFNIIRIWPQALYFSFFAMYGLARYYKFAIWQWILFGLALIVCRTFTLYISILVAWLISLPDLKKKLKFLVFGFFAFTILYFLDSEPVENFEEGRTSTLRIKSSVYQFTDLLDAKDEEDLSKFGSNRMVMVFPAFESLYELKREWTGIGLIKDDNDIPGKYLTINTSMADGDKAERPINSIEIIPIYEIITVGYLGFIIHCVFFVFLWLFMRKLKYARFFETVLVSFIIMGLSGFAGLAFHISLYMIGLSMAAVILANRGKKDTDHSQYKKFNQPSLSR